MSPHDVVLIIGLIVLAIAQLLIHLSEAPRESQRRNRSESARVRANS